MNMYLFTHRRHRTPFGSLITKLYYKFGLRSCEQVCRFLREGGAKIGRNVHISTPEMIGSEPYLISIGDDVYFSGNQIQLVTHDGSVSRVLYNAGLTDKKYDYFGKITIGNNCFIGVRTVILKGVTVGDNCIIGAGSVVTKDIPANSVACGSPARVISTVGQFYEKNKAGFSDTHGLDYQTKKKALLGELK